MEGKGDVEMWRWWRKEKDYFFFGGGPRGVDLGAPTNPLTLL